MALLQYAATDKVFKKIYLKNFPIVNLVRNRRARKARVVVFQRSRREIFRKSNYSPLPRLRESGWERGFRPIPSRPNLFPQRGSE